METTDSKTEVVKSMVEGMTVESVPITSIKKDPRNARRGDVAVIIESLREFGQHRPAVVRRDNNQIIVGNHMFEAAKTLGWTHLDVVFVDDDEEKALRRGLADNATGDKAHWDEALLAELLQETGPLPGITQNDIERLLADVSDSLGIDDDEEQPIYPIVARPNEEYDYVLVVAQNATDCAYLRTKFQLRKEKSYKSESIGMSHVVSVERLQELWGS